MAGVGVAGRDRFSRFSAAVEGTVTGLGLTEIIAFLMALSGFGVEPNPKAVGAAEVGRYAPAEADIMVHLDTTALVPGNFKALLDLQSNKDLAAIPALRTELRKAVAQVDSGRGMLKATLGLDVTTDVTSVTGFAHVTAADPEFLVVVRGRLAGVVDKAATLLGTPPRAVHGRPTVAAMNLMVAETADGQVLVGKPAWVEARLAPTWKPTGLTGRLAGAARIVDAKPALAVAVAPSPAMLAQLGPDAIMLGTTRFAGGSLLHNGTQWVMQGGNAADYQRHLALTEGYVDLLRAAHLAPRGMARMFLAYVDVIAASDRDLAELARNKPQLTALVERYFSGGEFQTKIDREPREHRVSIRLTGKKLSDVLPVGALVGLGAIGWLTATQEAAAPAPTTNRPIKPAKPTPARSAPTKPATAKPATGKPATAKPAPTARP